MTAARFGSVLFVVLGCASFLPAAEPRIIVVFRNDDISAHSDPVHESQMMEIFRRYGVRQTQCIIPNGAANVHDSRATDTRLLCDSPEMMRLLHLWQNEGLIEIALHGYDHRTRPRWLINDLTEFADAPFSEQLERISTGKQLLEEWFNVEVKTFCPPFLSYDPNTVRAVTAAGLSVVAAPNDFPRMSDDIAFVPETVTFNQFQDAYSQARGYVETYGGRAIVVVADHSAKLNTPRKIARVEQALRCVAELGECEVMTVAQVAEAFPNVFRVQEVSLECRAVLADARLADRLLHFLGRPSRPVLQSRFFPVPLDTGPWVDELRGASNRFWLYTCCLAAALGTTVGVVPAFLVARFMSHFGWHLFSALCLLGFVVVVATYRGWLESSPGISALDWAGLWLILTAVMASGGTLGLSHMLRRRRERP